MTTRTSAAIDPEPVMRSLLDNGFGPFIGVPCSILGPLIAWCERHIPDAYCPTNNEGEAVAVAAGAHLAGRRPVVMMQNSGLGNAVNPLTSLCAPMRIPILLLLAWRGEPGRPDEPQHDLMGRATLPMLDLMGVGHEVIVPEPAELHRQVHAAADRLRRTDLPYALVVRAGTFRPAKSAAGSVPSLPLRRAMIGSIMAALPDDAVVVATTGKTARELEAGWDRPTNLYVVGSMGCASSIGLGMALHAPDRSVVVLDGDGAALMRLEAMVTIGARRPERLVHVILDNTAYESTGGQRTHASTVNFAGIASACGYRNGYDTDDPDRAAAFVRAALGGGGPHLLRTAIAVGSDPGLGRPALAPADVARRLRGVVAGAAG